MRNNAFICLVLTVTLVSCSGESSLTPPAITPDDVVRANAQLVRVAADAWAALDPNGEFPLDLSATTAGGQTLIDLLPTGAMLQNPYSGLATEPRDGAVNAPGQVGYAVRIYGGAQSLFDIEGYGENAVIIHIDNIADLEAMTIANATIVRDGVEAWALDNNGLYPANGSDQGLAGKTLHDYLPQPYLQNPFSLANTEPVNGAAANPGEIGYMVTIQGGQNVGYLVTAWGMQQQIAQFVKDQ